MSIPGFLDLQERTEDHLELHDGEVVALPLFTFRHGALSTRLTQAIGEGLEGHACQVLGFGLCVGAPGAAWCVHPDATVLCGPPEFHGEDDTRSLVVNARVMFELSGGNSRPEADQRRTRMLRSIPTLEEHATVYVDRPEVEVHRRQPDGSWGSRTWSGHKAVVEIRCLGVDLPLADFYDAPSDG